MTGPARFPLLDPVFPLLERGKPDQASRQERQIVQSWLDLDDFLLGFTSPLRGLSGVRSNHLSYRPLLKLRDLEVEFQLIDSRQLS